MNSHFLDFKHPSTAQGQMVNIIRFDLISFFFSTGKFWGEAFCKRTVMIHLCTLFCEQHVVLQVSSSPDTKLLHSNHQATPTTPLLTQTDY